MAVSVDTVYQRVLAILNKEQRGYITPQEFNLFAGQAQMEIFEQYFYDINQFSRLPGNDTEYSDMLNILNEKINLFATSATLVRDTGSTPNHFNRPANLYRIGSILFGGNEVERVNKNEYLYIQNSPLAKPTNDFPIYIEFTEGYRVFGSDEKTADVTCNYIKKPANINWAYNTVSGAAVYNASNSVDSELHESEETELVIKVLRLAGLAIKDPSVYQIGAQMEAQGIQQEKA
jgi:hypothetical protein